MGGREVTHNSKEIANHLTNTLPIEGEGRGEGPPFISSLFSRQLYHLSCYHVGRILESKLACIFTE